MAGVKGREHRTGVSDAVFLGVRISPDNFDKLDDIAEATRRSKAAIVDWLLSHLELDERGRPLGWDLPSPNDQQELPLTKSA